MRYLLGIVFMLGCVQSYQTNPTTCDGTQEAGDTDIGQYHVCEGYAIESLAPDGTVTNQAPIYTCQNYPSGCMFKNLWCVRECPR